MFRILLVFAGALGLAKPAAAGTFYRDAPPWHVWSAALPTGETSCVAKYSGRSAAFGFSKVSDHPGLLFLYMAEEAAWRTPTAVFARVDDGPPWHATARANKAGTTLTAPADNAADLVEQLETGATLSVVTMRGAQTFMLSGARDALSALADCAQAIGSPGVGAMNTPQDDDPLDRRAERGDAPALCRGPHLAQNCACLRHHTRGGHSPWAPYRPQRPRLARSGPPATP